jgi:septal ring factor EnvC (AmiA/AmiB activator)
MRDLFASETTRRREVAAADPARAAEYLELSGSFLSNQGRLPWPSQGVVIEPFGDVVNPVHGTTTPNPGVFIRTRPSDEIRAVFRGEVILVDVMPGFGRLVVVSHGDFKSLYSNFSLIYVQQGMQVEAGQVLGRAGTDAEPKGSGLFFSVFNRGEAVDPTEWLRPD